MVNLTFQRELRLVTPNQFNLVFQEPIKAASPNLTILARKNDLSHIRLGLIVPKKVLKKAVDRNHIKRLTRNFFRLNQHDLPPLDFVVIAKNNIGSMENKEIVDLLNKLCIVISRRYKKLVSS